MFDVGRNRLRAQSMTGPGLMPVEASIDLVLARIEIGYVAALRPLPGDAEEILSHGFFETFF